jgi:arylsulfatase A
MVLVFSLQVSCTHKEERVPNVILIMTDDMGYECLNSYVSNSYQTPELDRFAAEGMQFNHAYSQPLCTPSRVKIMTGKYNYRNYSYFGHLRSSERTFGNLMQDKGYATCIVGKWQLNGLSYKDEIPDWHDNSRPQHFGFEEYCLWQLTRRGGEGGRYANPLIEQNGEILELEETAFGPDVFTNYLIDFISRNKDRPFFAYYPMVLVHDPFVATPGTGSWENEARRFKSDTARFGDMIAHTDKIIGRLMDHLKTLDLDEQTLVIFTSDNGTHPSVYTPTANGIIRGAKGNTTDAGTRVPLLARWPGKIEAGSVNDELIGFHDVVPTLADLTGQEVESDGMSFLPLLIGEAYEPREFMFMHYDPRWNKNVSQHRDQFVRDKRYKLYPSGDFFDLQNDPLEYFPLVKDSVDNAVILVWEKMQLELSRHPGLK